MKEEKRTLFDICSAFFMRNKNIIAIIAAILFIFAIVNYDDEKINIHFESNLNIYFFLVFIICIIIFFCINIISKKIIFGESGIHIERRMLFIKIAGKIHNYNEIYKFIMGRYYKNALKGNYYSIYIDKSDEIIKMISLKSYKECMKVIENIKTMTTIGIYDDTDTFYAMEEDLFRNYYKMKKMVNEIKNE